MSKMERELSRAAERTFEEVAFLLPEPETEAPETNSPQAAASVGFQGPFRGKLIVKISEELLPELAANMLGEEGGTTERQQRDALREIANIVCGNALPGIAGSKEIFHIDAPIDLGVDELSAPSTKPAAEVRLTLDQGRAELQLYIESEVQ